MLNTLSVQNLAVVEQLELIFQPGMTVLTGETGAGKSILIDALGLVLGGRLLNNMIRTGCKIAEISANFTLDALPDVQTFLKEQELEACDECIIRRIITMDGRTRAFINGHAVPLTQVKQLGELLVNIHGQHQHQSLLKTEYQRSMLDAYASHYHLCEEVKNHYSLWQKLKKRMQELSNLQGQQEKLALLQYQVQELSELNLGKDELVSLTSEHKKLASSELWITLLENALLNLEDGPEDNQAISTSMNQILINLAPLKEHDASVATSIDLLSSALINIKEATLELKSFRESLNVDPERFAFIENRLSQIHTLARKHKISPDLLLPQLQRLEQEILTLEKTKTNLSEIEQQLKSAEQAYLKSAALLTASRKKTALELEKCVTDSLASLEMPHGQFKIAFSENPSLHFSAYGQDDIEFLVSTNPGIPLLPLRKIVSGGELSRISLAIQVITAKKMTIPTLIFDEVDVGISGKTAEMVGRLLRTLGNNAQVLCVTHLPQVATQGHYHYKVEKQQSAQTTTTHIYPLFEENRTQEIARMLGGIKITKQTMVYAKEMLSLSQT